jgi:hypothetical protein
MRMRHRSIRLVLVAALAVFAFAAVASSAMAVSVEPLNTKFTGKTTGEVSYNFQGVGGACTESTLTGTTNATKTNYINATDAFTGCRTFEVVGSITTVFSNSCAKEGTVPWTLTFNEGGTTGIKLNCAIVAKKVFTGGCTITVPEQTVSNAANWTNVAPLSLEVTSRLLLLKSLKWNEACAEVGVKPTELTITDTYLFKGIHAV